MTWTVLAAKIKSVNTELNEWELQVFETEFSKLMTISDSMLPLQSPTQSQWWSSVSCGAVDSLFVDLLYAISKHRPWLQTPVFSAILVEFLQLDHKLPRPEAMVIVEKMVATGKHLGLIKDRTICIDDREFLTYAFVAAAGSAGASEMECELGLGTAVLNILRSGILALDHTSRFVFLSDYEAMLAEIILELKNEIKLQPWALDLHRLKYHLLSVGGDDVQSYILEETIASNLEQLVEIGMGVATKANDPMIRVFKDARLILDMEGVQLTTLGATLTAACVTTMADIAMIHMKFEQWNPYWQEQVIRNSSDFDFDSLWALVHERIPRLAPRVVEAAVRRMIELSPEQLTSERLQSLLAQSKFSWHQSALIRALDTLAPTQSHVGVVADAMVRNMTPGVRLAATGLLETWTQLAVDGLSAS